MRGHSSGKLCAGVVLLLALLVATRAWGDVPRFHRLSTSGRGPASWLATDGSTVVYGDGQRLYVDEAERVLDVPVTGAVLLGRRLVLVQQDWILDLDVRSLDNHAIQVDLEPQPAGNLHVAQTRGVLVVAEDGFGLRFLESVVDHDRHHDHTAPGRLRPVGIMELRERFTAVAANATTVFAALAGKRLAVVDVREVGRPRLIRMLPLEAEPHSMSADASTLTLLGPDGLRVIGLLSGTYSVSFQPEVRGTAISGVGRLLHVAGDRGVETFRDGFGGPQTYTVSVNNNFFNPPSLKIQVGDTVQWTNTSGLHNVFSCTTDQIGCGGVAANERFSSGEATTFWFYDYTFTSAGDNPYVCQPHAAFMSGLVTVEGTGLGPPRVPDGSPGEPMTAAKLDPDGTTLSISWDAQSCSGAADYEILYGTGSQLPATPGGPYGLAGAMCSIGGPPFVWKAVPDPAADPSRFLWWLVVATDGSATEGSWGVDSSNNERGGTGPGGASGECGITVKDISNACE